MSRMVGWAVLVALAATLTVGCASRGRVPPPVEDRNLGSRDSLLPGSENAGKPGYYTVKPGDTLIRIGMDHGQSWRDIVRWNNLDNPNVIETGQVLRVVPPAQETGVVVRPIASSSAQAVPVTPTPAQPAPAAQPAAPASPAQPASNAATADAVEEAIRFQWPAKGHTLAGFDESKNKGIDIAGKAGDPVFAAADGKVVYAGSGLRGYGNLIIIKHNNTYLTAYAHNQTLLAKEDQVVKRGQKIAEMGNSDADQVKLHFEVRRQGKPVDPMRYLLAN
jgi:lipoprotein NlpD